MTSRDASIFSDNKRFASLSSLLSGVELLSLASKTSSNSNKLKSPAFEAGRSIGEPFRTSVSSLLVEKPWDSGGVWVSTGNRGFGELWRLFMIKSNLLGELKVSTGVLPKNKTKMNISMKCIRV